MSREHHGGARPAVSIVVPVRNRRADLDRLLAATLASIRPLVASFEVIIHDDASDDGSGALLADLEARAPWLRIRRRNRSGGRLAALREAFHLSRAPVIVVVDPRAVPGAELFRSLLASIKQGGDVVAAVRVGAGAGGIRRAIAWLAGWLDGRRATGAAARAYRRHALGLLLERRPGRRPWRNRTRFRVVVGA